jgi:hypothetical protein
MNREGCGFLNNRETNAKGSAAKDAEYAKNWYYGLVPGSSTGGIEDEDENEDEKE